MKIRLLTIDADDALAADWLGCNERRIRKAAEYSGAVYAFHFRRLDEPEGGRP